MMCVFPLVSSKMLNLSKISRYSNGSMNYQGLSRKKFPRLQGLYNLVGGDVREKHSNTQIKRLFKHPGQFNRLRQLEELGVMKPKPPPPVTKFHKVFEPTFLRTNGWSAPPRPGDSLVDKALASYPFHIERTGNKPNNAVGFLPVYSDIRIGGTKKTTVIRKVSGDRQAFVQELVAVISSTDAYKDGKKEVKYRIRTGGNIEVDGIHIKNVREWLAGLGF